MAFCFILWMSCFYILLDLVERAPFVEEDPLVEPVLVSGASLGA